MAAYAGTSHQFIQPVISLVQFSQLNRSARKNNNLMIFNVILIDSRLRNNLMRRQLIMRGWGIWLVRLAMWVKCQIILIVRKCVLLCRIISIRIFWGKIMCFGRIANWVIIQLKSRNVFKLSKNRIHELVDCTKMQSHPANSRTKYSTISPPSISPTLSSNK